MPMLELFNVLLASVAAFAAGAVWYMTLAEPWMQAAGIARDAEGRPAGGMGPGVMVLGFVMHLLVAGMMRHSFAVSGIDTLGAGLVGGLGIGLFFITPWIVLNYAYAMRPVALMLIDGGYAVLAATIMGVVLVLF
jgi:hypothetical protein